MKNVLKVVLGFVIGVVASLFILGDHGPGIELGNMIFGIAGALIALFLSVTKKQKQEKNKG